MSVSGYLLLAPPHRREILLDAAREYEGSERAIAEPVPSFDRSRRSRLIVFGSFRDGQLTHVMDGRKGASAGEGPVRLNLTRWLTLTEPLVFDLLVQEIPPRFRGALRRAVTQGGVIPPKTLAALTDTIGRLAPDTAHRLTSLCAPAR